MSEKLKKFVKSTLFGRKKGKKDKRIKPIECAEVHVAARRLTQRSAYECEDVVDKFQSQRHSFYHNQTRRTRKTAKSMACGEDLDEAASDSDEEMVPKPRKVAFSGNNRRYLFEKQSPEQSLAREFDRMSMRNRRNSRNYGEEDKDRLIEKLKMELRLANQQISQQEFMIERKERKYDKLKGKYMDVRAQKQHDDTMNQSTLMRNSMLLPMYQPPYYQQMQLPQMQPNFFNAPANPPFFMPQGALPQAQLPQSLIPTPPSTERSFVSPGMAEIQLQRNESDLESVKNFRRNDAPMNFEAAMEGYATEESFVGSSKSMEKIAHAPSHVASGRRSH
ncbi:unnamed protein product [Bursaphelenchus xylophilus]|uniref:(pine wood nematode) hypothetical protein n=1 Tax=Bursaphelenchus xylophilus TaxID=6326 RepID=A0A1I7SV87_BURXY|nr:unnamed protein product [Bursaphelenchus xylophilus]CAG9101068.1 unnamed protein product [Bursaphelenchus xylophilus]